LRRELHCSLQFGLVFSDDVDQVSLDRFDLDIILGGNGLPERLDEKSNIDLVLDDRSHLVLEEIQELKMTISQTRIQRVVWTNVQGASGRSA